MVQTWHFELQRDLREILVASLPNLTSTEAGSAKAAPFVMPVPGTVGDVRSWRFEITAGVLEDECREIVVDFFKFRREQG